MSEGAVAIPGLVRASLWRRIFALRNVLTAIFLVVCGVFTFEHPLWRDEAQAFLIGRDSHSIGELFWNLRYEGHPPLWHFLIFLLTRITERPEAMQGMHLLMAAGSVYLVARFAPFPWPIKCLFPFGYFTLFEYGMIARNYQLFLLLTLGLCALWQVRRFSFLWTGVLLGLLCLTHVFGDILAAGLGIMFLLDAVVTGEGRAAIRRHPWRLLAGVVIVCVAAGASVHFLIPPADSGYKPEWFLKWNAEHAKKTLGAFWVAFVPLSEHTEHFWDTNIVQDGGERFRWGMMLAVAVVVCLMNSWRALVFFGVTVLGVLAFFYIKPMGATRHDGVLFVALVGAFWIAWVRRGTLVKNADGWRRWGRVVMRAVPRMAFGLLLAVQVYGAGVALYYCWKYPFTPGKAAAALVRAAMEPGDILVSGNQIITTSVAAYLPGEKFYFPLEDRWGTFTLWDQTPWEDASALQAAKFILKQEHPVIFIRCWDGGALGKLLGRFPVGIEENEMYTIYRVVPPKARKR